MTDPTGEIKIVTKSIEDLAAEEVANLKAKRKADVQAVVDYERSFIGFVDHYKWEILTLTGMVIGLVILAKHSL